MQVGISEIIITPPNPIGVQMGGYGDRNQLSTGIHDELYARVFYFQSETSINAIHKLFLISLDSVGISSTVFDHYRKWFADRFQIPIENIIFSCTHSHSTFESIGLLGLGTFGMVKSRLNTRILNFMMKKVYLAMKTAILNCESVVMGWEKVVPKETLGRIRRKNSHQKALIALTTVKFLRPDGSLKGGFFNIGIHCTMLSGKNLLISADWPGNTLSILQELIKNQVPSNTTQEAPIFAFFQGAEGDINPILPQSLQLTENEHSSHDPFKQVEIYANYMATQIFNSLNRIVCKSFDSIRSIVDRVKVPIKSFPINSSLKENIRYITDSLTKKLLTKLFRSLNRTIFGFQHLVGNFNFAYAHVVELGELRLIWSPGELFYEFGEKLMALNGNYHKSIIIGFANDYASYLYPVWEYIKGGYENVFQLCPLNGPRVVGALKRILQREF